MSSKDMFSGLVVSGLANNHSGIENAINSALWGTSRCSAHRGVFSRILTRPGIDTITDGDLSVFADAEGYRVELRGAFGCLDNGAEMLPFALTIGGASAWTWCASGRIGALVGNAPLIMLLMRGGSFLRNLAWDWFDQDPEDSSDCRLLLGDIICGMITVGKFEIRTREQLARFESVSWGDEGQHLIDRTFVSVRLIQEVGLLSTATLVGMRSELDGDQNKHDGFGYGSKWKEYNGRVRRVLAMAAQCALDPCAESRLVPHLEFVEACGALKCMLVRADMPVIEPEWPGLLPRLRKIRPAIEFSTWVKEGDATRSDEAYAVLRALEEGQTPEDPGRAVRAELSDLEFDYRPEAVEVS